MNIKQAAEKEMNRMNEIFNSIECQEDSKAKDFYSFSKNYFEDGKYFFKEEKYVESFEAFIISWSYLDAGIKLGFFKTPLLKYFTVEE